MAGGGLSRLQRAWLRFSGVGALQAQLQSLERQVDRLTRERMSPPVRPYYYLGEGRALSFLKDGPPMYVYTPDRSISPWLITAGVWETFVDDVMMDWCEAGMHVCDIGANQGYYTLKFAARVGPEGRVTALEPNPAMFTLMRDSVELNGFSGRVRLHNAAAGEQDGVTTITFDPRFPGGGHLFQGPPDENQRQLQTRVLRVDDILDPDRALDLVKVDVEGWEPHVFAGMGAALERSPEAAIFTELSWQQWSRAGAPEEMLGRLAQGRRIFLIRDDATLQTVDPDEFAILKDAGFVYVLLVAWTDKAERRLGSRVRR